MPQTFRMPSARPQVKRPKDCPVRKGDWAVDHSGRIGIVASLHMNPELGLVADFHLTGKEGQTILALDTPAYSLRRAFADEIPFARREHLTDDDLQSLGFMKR